MIKVHGKDAKSLVYNWKISDLKVINSPLSIDKKFARYLRRYNTYAKKGV